MKTLYETITSEGRIPVDWKKLTIDGYDIALLAFPEESMYGINNGRISKLEIRKGSKVLLNYDRGWDTKNEEEPDMDNSLRKVYDKIIKEYN